MHIEFGKTKTSASGWVKKGFRKIKGWFFSGGIVVLLKRLDKLEESDFAIFRTSFESGRQTPDNIRNTLILGVFGQLLSGFGIFAAADPTMHPEYNKAILLSIQYILTFILIICSIIFSIPAVYRNYQTGQLIVVSLMLLNFISIFPYFAALFMLVRTVSLSEKAFFILAIGMLLLGISFLIAILVRLQRSLANGDFRRESKKYNYEKVLERERSTFSKLPEFIIAATGFVFILEFLLEGFLSGDIENMIFVILFFALFFMGMYLFAYSMISIYCKKRFSSFNFDKEGNLQPWGSGDRKKRDIV